MNELKSRVLLEKVLQIAYQAGTHLNRFYDGTIEFQIKTKSDNTPVTNADLFVNQFLIEKLTALTPHIPVLSEENCQIPFSHRRQWSTYWLIDPLDGTQQFINRTDQFAVLIALVHQNRSILGIIHAPVLKQTYYALQGHGAYKQTEHYLQTLSAREIDLNHRVKIAVGSKSAAQKVRSVLNPNYQYEFITYGSSGLKTALVAEGSADCYIRLGQTGEWDTAAAEAILSEIGGGIRDTQFNALTYNKRPSLINPDFIMVSDIFADWKKIFQFN
ncbi:3'(2'),5'-bisphosphate nucleotidase [Histophilus somni]|uniref:3'(2'),5'-bisphosphate nucleotidase CysQ n=1 Tax=Histophilus somni TaxID=731 RepID=A0A9Q6Z0H5_HISSO|nr:3'(2'),5'-bisphosphate nucleotidase CysQ [Histophilus somni]ARU67544.1 3'(2'),5'-bisphosphate nucleotidase [Histophilus somni]ARU69426.1 3'(2'),5'-bisphosphate nucleotidase [Histophilus somni]ARU71302.1 3'(2'),5'-bisphosphate nucleotidase [Histophilus somni]ARU73173.1 3'(2'),5'-bisphosphate nucleotidase [Histophilus somni]ARU75138.1 3'(2'),5'-bisphosphate nucleotidase [Histophilus somni]